MFSGKPHKILHNSKSSKPYIRTSPSTLHKLKECCAKNIVPKVAVSMVTKEKGGIINAGAVGDIPRNRRQVYNIKSEKSDENDALLSVMVMCKQSTAKDDPFVRIVTSAPEPMSILCTESQLIDLERFCTSSDEFCPLSVDPTFNLGDFSVTVTSFRNLLLKNETTGKHPVMIGLMLVHRCKLFSSYHFFASSLVSLKPSLSGLLAFGTDGEECLHKAFSAQFSKAQHLRCFLHFRDNMKRKLIEMKISNDGVIQIIQDVLGSYLRGKRGLVDARSAEELQSLFVALKSNWEVIAPGFFDWFLQYKIEAIESSMLAPIRQSSGLGNPPEPFYTNEIESINRVLKRKVDCKASEWPAFCVSAKELIEEQEHEIEKAIIGVGEYQFREEFKHLQIPIGRWSSMNTNQRENYLAKISKLSLQEARKTSACRKECRGAGPSGSNEVYMICGSCFNAEASLLAGDVLAGIFKKAERLVKESNSICQAPGSVSGKVVASESGNRPHFVTVRAKYNYICDSDCAMWKCSKLCSHTVACAYTDGNLQQFLSRAASVPNLYELAKSGTTKSAGKKPQKRKASSKSTTRVIAAMQAGEPPSCGASNLPVVPVQASHIPVNTCASVTAGVSQSPGMSAHTADLMKARPRVPTARVVQSPIVSVSQVMSSRNPVSGGATRPRVTARVVQSPTVLVSQIVSAGSSVTAEVVQSPTVSVSQIVPAGSTMGAPRVTARVVQSPTVSVSHYAPTTCSVYSPTISRTPSTQMFPTPTFSAPATSPSLAAAGLANLISQVLTGSGGTSGFTSIDPKYLFWLVVLGGNISRCQGCSGKIFKSLPPPEDIVLQHKEQVLFQNPNTGSYQLSREHRNVYYHAQLSCVLRKFPTFKPEAHFRISNETLAKLKEVHKDYILREFKVRFK